ncbi:MAG TPA: dephospho-CoA kinase [Candidatus Treponema faecavium]|nr:dephospho-CoA kinase [Candidatus Treponema faecavium]
MNENAAPRAKGCPVICIAGPMAAGKNAAAQILAARGWAVIDADTAAHQAVELAKDRILARFSAEAAARRIALLDGSGRINRRALGELVFSHAELLAAHEAIVHPVIHAMLSDFIDEHAAQPVALNATVLYKTAVMCRCSHILFVTAPAAVRLLRARRRDRMPYPQIFDRFRRQKNILAQYQKTNADIYKVVNIGSIRSLERKIDRFLTFCLS